jgi:hypothetical protein
VSRAAVVAGCYNADPLSMRAALDDSPAQDTAGRPVPVRGGVGKAS